MTTLQAAVFEGSNQIATLNLAMSRLEKAQRGDKDPSMDDVAGAAASAPDNCRSARLRRYLAGTPMTMTPPIHASTLAPASHFRNFKEDPLPWLNRCETFFMC